MTCSRGRRRRPGLTLIEVLVAISIIAVLLSIALPVLSAARETADRHALEKRQHDAHFALRHYAMDHRQEFPYYATPGTLDAQLWFGDFRLCGGYWSQATCWAAYVTELGYETGLFQGPPSQDDSPPTRPRHARWVWDRLTFTAFASPNYWGDFADQDIDLHQPQRWSVISHPSRKGLLIYSVWVRRPAMRLRPEAPQVVTFADGHTETRRMREFRHGAHMFYHSSFQSPVLTTRDGLQGRDL